jgi:SAM-dependent methyltransferase
MLGSRCAWVSLYTLIGTRRQKGSAEGKTARQLPHFPEASVIEQPSRGAPLQQVPFSDVAHDDRFQTSFYSHARYYSLVARQNHPFRIPWFIRRCCEEYGLGKPASGLELGCGPALHSIDFVEQDVRMSALDISPEMLEIAAENALARGVSVDLVLGNLIRYEVSEPFDFVMSLGLNSSHVLTNEEMLEHLASVAASLKPGGLYFIELEFVAFGPRMTFRALEPPWILYDTQPALYAAQGAADGLRVTFLWGGPEAYYDPIRQIFRSTNSIVLERAGEREVIERSSIGKIYMPLELRCLVACTGDLELVEWYRDYYPSATFGGHPEADRYIAVIRRRR